MTIPEILTILFIHWFGDFVLQTDWQAKNKSSRTDALIAHTGVYSLFWFACLPSVFSIFSDSIILSNLMVAVIQFVIVTFVAHTATDYVTSRINTKLWSKNKVHYFFVSVGFDQWLHYLQLFLTYQYLKP